MEKEILYRQLTIGCHNQYCQNQYCISSKQYKNIQITENELDEIILKNGRFCLCILSIQQILERLIFIQDITTVSELYIPQTIQNIQQQNLDINQLQKMKFNDIIIQKLQNTTIQEFITLTLQVYNTNIQTMSDIQYIFDLNSQTATSTQTPTITNEQIKQAVYNFDILYYLLERSEQLIQNNQQTNTIIKLSNPITTQIQQLNRLIYDTIYTLFAIQNQIQYELLITLMALPSSWQQRNYRQIYVISWIFNKFKIRSEKAAFTDRFLSFMTCLSQQERYDVCVTLIQVANSWISVQIAQLDRPNRFISIYDLNSKRSEIEAVLLFMQLLYVYKDQLVSTAQSAQLSVLMQNNYVNSAAYNWIYDLQLYLQQFNQQSETHRQVFEQETFQQNSNSSDPLNIPTTTTNQGQQSQYQQQQNQFFSLLDYQFILSVTTKQQLLRYEITQNARPQNVRVRRDNVAYDLLQYINEITSSSTSSANAIKQLQKPIAIKFVGEEGIDAGGLSSEFFTLWWSEILNVKYNLFTINTASNLYWINKFPMLNDSEMQQYYTYVGYVIAYNLLNCVLIENKFPAMFWKRLMQQQVTLSDICELDPQLHSSLSYIQNCTDQDVFTSMELTFSLSESVFGTVEHVDLIENGSQIAVDVSNRHQYVNAVVKYISDTSVHKQLTFIRKGFTSIVNSFMFQLFSVDDLIQCLSGVENLDFNELKQICKYEAPYTQKSQIIEWFWDILLNMTLEQKKAFMKFTFACEKAPADGLKHIRFEIHKNGQEDNRLPTSHTCFGILLLPQYSSKQILKQRLMTAIQYNEYFGLE